MEPISVTATVVAAACAIASAVHSVQQLRDRYKLKKTQAALDPKPDTTSITAPPTTFNLSVQVNCLVAKFGSELETESGGKSTPVRAWSFFVLRVMKQVS
jgi:hypothetical protein